MGMRFVGFCLLLDENCQLILVSQIARKVLSDVAYVQTLHGPLRRLIVRAFVASFRRTFGMLPQTHILRRYSTDFAFSSS
jgi:hypothetical protein